MLKIFNFTIIIVQKMNKIKFKSIIILNSEFSKDIGENIPVLLRVVLIPPILLPLLKKI